MFHNSFYLLGYTLPKIRVCVECAQQYRTYIPNTDCLFPDGKIVYYKQSQDKWPDCSGGSFLSINEDLFPHLVKNN